MERKQIKQDVRKKVFEKFDGRCAYCGCKISLDYRKKNGMEVDHIHPVDRGGGNETENLFPACKQCNFYKSVFFVDEFREQLRTLHKRIAKPFICRLGLKYGIIQLKPFDRKFYFEKTKEVYRND